MKQICFAILPTTQILDLAGPVQVFDEARQLGAAYELRYVAVGSEVVTAQGLGLGPLEPYAQLEVRPGDLILVPGLDGDRLGEAELAALGEPFFAWLRAAYAAGASIGSICNATFVLAHAGLLEGRRCTTHWKRVQQLQRTYPGLQVLENRLFVKEERLYSSAGVCSGIDLALALVEEDQGAAFAARVARELVVYLRRDGAQPQLSAYLDHRGHLNPRVHELQDWVAQHPGVAHSLEGLAERFHLSTRHLTRLFKQETGITLKAYLTEVRLEHAGQLLRSPGLSIDQVASACGFQDPRPFRRLWKAHRGDSPQAWRARLWSDAGPPMEGNLNK